MKRHYIRREIELTKEDFKRLKRYRGVVLRYSQICEILRVEMYAGAAMGGQQQFNHIAKMARFAKLSKVPGGYLVEKIYNKERFIVVKRKRAPKFRDATKVFEYNLKQLINSYPVLSKNRCIELAGFVNENYAVALKNVKEAAEVLEVEVEVLEKFIHYFGNLMKLNFMRTIEKSRAVRDYTRGTVVVIGKHHRLANEAELKAIADAEDKALAEVSCISKGQVFVRNKWDAFMSRSKKALEGIKYYYDGYKLKVSKNAVKTTEAVYEKAKANVKALVEESILKSLHNPKAKKPKSKEFIAQIEKLIEKLVKDTDYCLANELPVKELDAA